MARANLTPGVHGRYATRRGVSSRAPKRGLMSSEEFFDLLRARTPANAAAVDREVERRGVRKLAILMSDSSGFSRKTHEYGILQFLAVMTQRYDELIPVIEKHHGDCLSHNADNILAIFDKPADAVAAAVAMHRLLKRRNAGKPDREQFNVCIGIHYGPVVRLKDNVFGDRVNVAAKLGEDIASKDEIVVTAEVAKRAAGRFKCPYSRSIELGGRRFEIHKVVH